MTTDYLRQTKSNIEEKMRDYCDCADLSDCERDTPPINFIIDNFKAAQNTFNVILAQRENDLQRITQLSVKNEQQRAEIDKLDTQKYNCCLENSNLRIEIEDIKKNCLNKDEERKNAKTIVDKKLSNLNVIAIMSVIFNCIMISVLVGS